MEIMRIKDDKGFFEEMGINIEEDKELDEDIEDEEEYKRMVKEIISIRKMSYVR